MALIICSECGGSFSDEAAKCPKCGAIFSPKGNGDKAKPEKKTTLIIVASVCLVLVAAFFFRISPCVMLQKEIEKKDEYAAQVIDELYATLEDISAKSGNTLVTKMGALCATAREQIDAFESLPVDYESKMVEFILDLRSYSGYHLFRDSYMHGDPFDKVGTDPVSLSLSGEYAIILQNVISAITDMERPAIPE